MKTNLPYDERSAGGIVYKIENKKILWLLIKTKGRRKVIRIGTATKRHPGPLLKSRYKFPKGHLNRDEFLKQAALREVEEEGGIRAEIIEKLGSKNYIIWDTLKRKKIIKKVTFFLMKYLGASDTKYHDAEVVLAREWLSFQEACKKLAYD
ncbi:NUDIX domain-containing protein, partial [Patescibacteria group bacterium]|nr:NUDIX domain-containing protein [Patescibacteria group bacterium]